MPDGSISRQASGRPFRGTTKSKTISRGRFAATLASPYLLKDRRDVETDPSDVARRAGRAHESLLAVRWTKTHGRASGTTA